MRRIALILALILMPAAAYAQSYDQRMRDSRLPDRELGSAGLQMWQFGRGKVGKPVYVKESPEFNEYEVSVAPFVIEEEKGPIKVILKRSARMPIYLDSVVMKVGGRSIKPTRATADGKDVTAKLSAKDSEYAPFQELVLEFPPIGKVDVGTATLSFTAAAGSVDRMVHLPAAGEGPVVVQSSKYFNYLPGSHKGTIVLDGDITPKDELGKANFREMVEIARGEEKKPIHMWVRDNGEELSVVFDVAADETPDEADDKIVLYVRGKGPLASFTAGAGGGAYGRMGSAYTSASKMEHRVYEFVIPFSQLPQLDDKGKWGISFAVTM